MVFRDDRDALRARNQALQSELDELREKLEDQQEPASEEPGRRALSRRARRELRRREKLEDQQEPASEGPGRRALSRRARRNRAVVFAMVLGAVLIGILFGMAESHQP